MNKILPVPFRSHQLWDCCVCYVLSPNNIYPGYQLYGYMVVVGIDNTFDSEIEGHWQHGVRGLIVNRRIRNTYRAAGATLLVAVIEPASSWGRKFASVLGKKPCVRIEDVFSNGFDISLLSVGFDSLERNAVIAQIERFFDTFVDQQPEPRNQVPDERIHFTLTFIENNIGETIELATIADLIHLSPERVRHLFTEKVGIPFTKYILWRRLRKVIYAVATKQMRLNQAVSQSGFTDQAHFNHVFKNIFGISPKCFLQISSLIV